MSASQTRFFSLSHLGFLGVLCLLPRVVNSDIISPKPFIRNVRQDAVFMWNSTNKNRILEARWGLLSADGLLKPQFIYIDISNNLVYSNALDGNASSYKGRVRWLGDLSAGHAWFKITNLIDSDTNQYAAAILEQGKTDTFVYSTKLTVAVNSDIISPKPFIRNVRQDAVFMWNSTNGNRILEARWGLLSDGLLKPQFIYIDISNNLVYSNVLDGNASSYKGRVRWLGDLSAGHAWFKITNLIISDTKQYAAVILEQGKTDTFVYSTKLTVAGQHLPLIGCDHSRLTHLL